MIPIRVLLAEDHHLVRDGLRLLMEGQPDMEVVAEAASGSQAVALARQLRPDVVVMDITMPDMDGLAATRVIRSDVPEAQVLILSMHASDVYFFQALDAGAAGYVVKKAASDELLDAVRVVANGDAYFHPSVARKLLQIYRHRASADSPELPGYASLTAREREVMMLLIQGYTNQEVAERLAISPSTVQAHRTRVLEKLNLRSVIDLVRYAIRHGLMDP